MQPNPSRQDSVKWNTLLNRIYISVFRGQKCEIYLNSWLRRTVLSGLLEFDETGFNCKYTGSYVYVIFFTNWLCYPIFLQQGRRGGGGDSD